MAVSLASATALGQSRAGAGWAERDALAALDPLCQPEGLGSVGRLAVKRCALCPAGSLPVTAAPSRRLG
jgi:hypothetical protein